MAPLRSSRSTRNNDPQAASRNRAGLTELDPTDGLPVVKWGQQSVKINQDPASDPSGPTNLPGSTILATDSAEWQAQFETEQYPWPEPPLPSFFHQLPAHNREFVRRARVSNTNPIISTWNSKTQSWNSGAEMEKRQNAMRSGQFGQVDPSVGSGQKAAPDSPIQDDVEDRDDKSDEDADGEHGDDTVEPTSKRRKKFVPEERMFEVKKWAPVPAAVAEKTEERKFLADRRPGMPSLYGGPYQNQVFGSMGLNTNGYGFSTANAGPDLGNGSGLGNTDGVAQSSEGAVAPVRRNMPPKRKKKKGGPGRKKANPELVPQNGASGVGATNTEANPGNTAGAHPTEDVAMGDGDVEGSDSGSEAEGSEEGEIDEGGHDSHKPNEAVVGQAETYETMTIDPMLSAMESHTLAEPQGVESGVAQSQTSTDATMIDTTMQDQPAQGPEVAAPITQPSVVEQLPDSMREAQPNLSPPQLPEVNAATAVAQASAASTGMPTLTPVTVEQERQLAPITTTVSEAMVQAPTSAPGPDVATLAAAPAPIPEPTSPDLLGGLEVELDKKMGEQAGE